MDIKEQKKQLETLSKQFDIAHAELKAKLKAAQDEKNFSLVIALLNEERAMVKENTEKILAMAASKS